MSEYNKIITIEMHVFGKKEEPYDIIPVLLKIIDDIISRGGYISGPCEQLSGLYMLDDSFFVTTESTCPLVLSQSSILKYLQQVQKSKLIRRIPFSRLMIFLINLHRFLSSIRQWFLRHFWE